MLRIYQSLKPIWKINCTVRHEFHVTFCCTAKGTEFFPVGKYASGDFPFLNPYLKTNATLCKTALTSTLTQLFQHIRNHVIINFNLIIHLINIIKFAFLTVKVFKRVTFGNSAVFHNNYFIHLL